MKLPMPFTDNKKNINVVIETPMGSHNKYSFDPETQLFKLSKLLPEGMVFPLHFGFIPRTKGGDGDPLDVLVLMEQPSYPGCLIECTLIGTIEAEQIEKNQSVRNDRIIAAASESHRYKKLKSLGDMDKYMLDEIILFFKNYNKVEGKQFRVVGKVSRKKTRELIQKNTIE